MASARRRKNNEKKRVTFDDGYFDDAKDERFNPRDFVRKRKLVLVTLVLCLVILYLRFSPPPSLPREVQFWHDSSYAFKFRNFEIFYQDIPQLTKPVSTAPVLLIIHGFPTSSYDWKDLIPDLHKKFPRIIIPDLLGFGFSDKPIGHGYTISEQATMIEELLVFLKINDVHVLAHDYGDTVLQELIARSNEPTYHLMFTIKSACLSNGGIIPSQHNPIFFQKLLTVPVLRNVLPYLTNRFIFSSRFSSVFAPNTRPTSKQLQEFWSIILYKRGHMVTSSILAYMAERHANEKRWVGALQETNIPLHLIYGPLDPINSPDGFLVTYKKLVPHSTVSVLENIGHYPQLEDRQGFIAGFNKFLQRVEDEHYVL